MPSVPETLKRAIAEDVTLIDVLTLRGYRFGERANRIWPANPEHGDFVLIWDGARDTFERVYYDHRQDRYMLGPVYYDHGRDRYTLLLTQIIMRFNHKIADMVRRG